MVEMDLDYVALEAGQQFPAIPIVLDADLVEAYISSTGHDHPLFATQYAPPLISNLVRFVGIVSKSPFERADKFTHF